MPRVNQAVAFVCAGAAAWISQASLALTDAGADLDRVALLPLSPAAIAISIVAGGVALIAIRRGLPLVAFAPLALCGLPWLPVRVPAAFLLWSGPLAVLPWIAVTAAALSTRLRAHGWKTRHQPLVAGLTATIVFSIAAWSTAATRPGGDEPHYLVITQSLIKDRDLRIENNHQRGDYREYFAGDLRPDFLRRGLDGQIYSIHAPGLPALAAPAFAIAGYRGVVVLLVLLSGLASALAWRLAQLQTGRADAAWFGWAAVTFAITTVFHAFSIYPDGPGGMIVLTGVWALVRLQAGNATPMRTGTWLLHGAALAVLPWLHARFAVLAGTLGALILLRLWKTPDRIRHSAAFVAVPVVSCAAWLAYFFVIYGVASPSAPYGEIGSSGYIADGLVGLFFDQRFGLLPYAPVLLFAIAGLIAMRNRLALELLLVVVPYLLVVTYFRMWWAGWSAPARFAAPVLPVLAIPAAHAWSAMRRRGTQATALGALILTATITTIVVSLDRGRLAYNTRTEPSLLLRRLARNADLPGALPAWSVDEAQLCRDVAIWSAVAVAAWWAVRRVDRVPAMRHRAVLAAAATGMFAIAAMTAATIVWRAGHVDGRAPIPGQMALMRRVAAESRAIVAGLTPPRAIRRDGLPAELRLRLEPLIGPGEPATDASPLFVLSGVPAGDYRLRPWVRGAGGGLSIAIGRETTPLHAVPAVSPDPFTLRLPVDVQGVVVRGDAEARRNVRGLVVEPVSLVPASERLTGSPALRALRYEGTAVFFLDNRSFPESEAFWVGGARDSAIVLRPDNARSASALLIRNAPVGNRVVIESGGWRDELQMAPGEERRVEVPLDPRRGSVLVRFSVSSGFRPSEVDPSSRDHRYLGAWIKVF